MAEESVAIVVMEEMTHFPEVIVTLGAKIGIGGMFCDEKRNVVTRVRDYFIAYRPSVCASTHDLAPVFQLAVTVENHHTRTPSVNPLTK